MKKVIHIVLGKAHPDRLNGVNKMVHYLADTQKRILNYDVEVWGISTDTNNHLPRLYTLRLFKARKYAFQVSSEIKSAIYSLDTNTIIHFHGALIPIYSAIAKILNQKSISYCVTPHGCLLRKSLARRKYIKRLYIHAFEKAFLNKAQSMQAITQEELNDISRIADKSIIHIIPNGLPSRVFQDTPLVQDRYAFPVFGYMGRFDIKHKNIINLLHAFYHYKENKKEGILLLIGDGRDTKRIQKEIRFLNLEEFVQILPPVFGPDKTAAYQNIDIIVHPSQWDVMPTSIIESCFHGKPVLITKETGMSSYIEKHQSGIISSDNSPLGIYHALKKFHILWENNQLSIYRNKAYDMAHKDFCLDIISQQYEDTLYRI